MKQTLATIFTATLLTLLITQTARADTDYQIAPLTKLETSLKFKRTPTQIQADTINGKAAPKVKLSLKPISFKDFVQLYVNMTKAKKGSAFIGVVVDTNNPNWKEGHIKDVHDLAQYLISGDPKNNKPGLALTDGASITGIIPIAYNSTDRAKKYVDAADMGNDDMVDITVDVNEVAIAINNHIFAKDKDGHFIKNLEDVYYAILDDAVLGRFGYDMREHADTYKMHVDRAAQEQKKRAAIGAWHYEDTSFVQKKIDAE